MVQYPKSRNQRARKHGADAWVQGELAQICHFKKRQGATHALMHIIASKWANVSNIVWQFHLFLQLHPKINLLEDSCFDLVPRA